MNDHDEDDEFYCDYPARDGGEILGLRSKRCPPHVEYLWVHRREGPRWLVSTWDADAKWMWIHGYQVTPDLELGKPVIRTIGTGKRAQYYRFERKVAA